ncbi:hypothetical protein [Sphingopyxis sp. PET50]|uniref:hypothetical protein n=1 Tax=Sphingopyxis sp. PET50 TaxID=2976533 RepID=UPI0021B00EE0|nr:hypothetical protein [Sphingopyxis sp. PET50]
MHSETTIVEIIRERQRAMRRELDRRGVAMKVVSQDSGIGYSTLLTYFPADQLKQPNQIPASAIFALAGAIPDDILSLLLPTGRLIVSVPEEIDHDTFAELARDYIGAKHDAHHVDSPAGREIAPCEDETLNAKAARLRAVSR